MLHSWAVPKGLPEDHTHDRPAVPVEDHEVDHATYEDDTKRIADTGWWELTITTLSTYAHLWPTAEDKTRAAASGMATAVLEEQLGSSIQLRDRATEHR